MARNIEIKVRVGDLDALRAAILALGARWTATEQQVDRYYELEGSARLKLRTINGQAAQLIRYDRPETSSVRCSEYEITPVRDAAAETCLVPKRRPMVTVRKRREIYLRANVRFHLDQVEELGTFLELEAVVGDAYHEATCRKQVDEITRNLDLDASRFVRNSYAELLLVKQ